MSPLRLRLCLAALFAGMAVWLSLPASSPACPFCQGERGPTLIGDFNQAVMVLAGTFTNPKLDAGGGLDGGTTDFIIEDALKSDPIIKGKKVITLPKYVPATKSKFVLFCDVYKGVIDPYRGVELQPGSDLVHYLKGGIAVKERPIGERLRYCFDYLNSPELEVALDAYREFAKADYADYRDMAKKLPANVIASWLRDPKTPTYRYGLYSSFLGLCGTPEHAKLLRQMSEDPEKRRSSGVDGMLVGYLLLQKKEGKAKEGMDYVRSIIGDGKQEFMMRYAALRAVRFLWDSWPDAFERKDLVDTVSLCLTQGDMADFAIEDLGKWGRWEMTAPVLKLFGKESHNVPVIKRAILRFALRCPLPVAAEFVQQQRQRDAEWVNDTLELLRLEAGTSGEPTPKSK